MVNKKCSAATEQESAKDETGGGEPDCSKEKEVAETPPKHKTTHFVNDIGKIINATLSHEELTQALEKLDVGHKYYLLTSHFRPSEDYIFPSRFLHHCQRQFKMIYLRNYKWMVYSPSLDAAFCIHCALMVPTSEKRRVGAFVNTPFTMFYKLNEKAKVHERTGYHVNAMLASAALRDSVVNPQHKIDIRFDDEKKKNIERNRYILRTVAEAIVFCGRQCIAIRGNNERVLENDTAATDLTQCRGNPGNFLAALQMIANHDDVLGHHLAGIGLANKNSKYTSPRIQNDIITIIGYDVIRSDLIEELKATRWFSILADEVTSSNKEELALCFCFVDTNNNIREEFLSFLDLSRITAAVIAGTILDFLKMTGLDATNIRGQGYDGAANMSSDNVGVQRLIKEHSPKAVYVHCSGHCLNLVIAHSCSLPCIRNTIDKLKTCCWFFLASPKREGLLQSIIRKALPEETKHRKGLLDLCKTRWAARHQAYTHFYQAYIYIITALENIVHGANVDACGLDFREAKWDPKCCSDAASLLASLTSFDFIVTFLTIYHFLSHLSGITVKLQGRSVDVIKAYHEISTVKAVYKAIYDDVEVEFSRSYKQAVIMASAVSTMPSMPRTVGRQTMRSNVPAATPEEHYRRNVAIPFLSHIQSELDSVLRFIGAFIKATEISPISAL
ncbi:zinc finger MYM-type protein 1-like [Gigantopelta aegis]|uniref:zinc finger MYM-type protein 1-like n=1 Tax=Gigantopelta aegis TaxID=1735272 RepID=UPI001B88E4F8|nr:zinc finger MYM-type protein 1-like [Gigantopelta aegis]